MYKIKINEVEGKDFINCNHISSTELGKYLHNTHLFEFNTVLGKCNKVKNFLDYCIYKDMDISHLLLNVRKKINNKVRVIPNYWGICAYVLYEKIKQHPKLKVLLKENTLPLTIYSIKKTNSTLGTKEVIVYAYKLEKYIDIIEEYQKLLKENNFNDESANKIIKKYSSTDDLFQGTDFIIK